MTFRGRSLFECLNGLRYFGRGVCVTRNIYKFPETYWVISRVRLTKDQKHGAAWGTMVWNGRVKQGSPEKIGAPLKKQWRICKIPEYKSFKGKVDDVQHILANCRATA